MVPRVISHVNSISFNKIGCPAKVNLYQSHLLASTLPQPLSKIRILHLYSQIIYSPRLETNEDGDILLFSKGSLVFDRPEYPQC